MNPPAPLRSFAGRRAALLLAVPLLLAAGRVKAVDYDCNVATDNGSWIGGQGSGTTGDLRY